MPESRPELESDQRWLAVGLALSISVVAAVVLRLRNGNAQPPVQNGGWSELDLGLPQEPDSSTIQDVATHRQA